MNETHWIGKLVPVEISYEDKWYETCKMTEKTVGWKNRLISKCSLDLNKVSEKKYLIHSIVNGWMILNDLKF